jgi:branched-chain amino acid transport system substrate-binding protein
MLKDVVEVRAVGDHRLRLSFESGAQMKSSVAGSVLALLLMAAAANAQETVKIGVIYPLSGNAASAGTSTRAAIELATEIINEAHPELGKLTLAADEGLPHLDGAKVEVVFADHQGNPAVGQNQTLRLITEEQVVALVGAYQSSVTQTASAMAERYGIPFLAPEAVAADLTERGFTHFFRTTPIAPGIADTYMAFLHDMQDQGLNPVESIAIVNENTDYGTSIAKLVREAAAEAGFEISLEIPYNANTTDVSSQVLQLKDADPDVVIFVSYTSDSILYMKTMRDLDYRPPMVIGDDSGFSDPSFAQSVGDIAQGAINRSAWDAGLEGSVTYQLNEMYKAKTGRDLDDTTGRGMQGFFVMLDAINRAGSTDPEAIREALAATDLKPDQLLMGYDGVKFDEKGQNTLATTLLIQLQGDGYVAVWPEDRAAAKIELPYQGWQ